MIWVTRFNGTRLYVNADMIQTVEGTPDTVITLLNGTKIVSKDAVEDVIERVIAYQQKVHEPHVPAPEE